MKSYDIAVIGGGVIGCFIAYELASRYRAHVCVFERGKVGQEASTAAAGILGAQLESHEPPHDGGTTFRFRLASRELYRILDERLRDYTGKSIGYRTCGALRVSTYDAITLEKNYMWQQALGGAIETLRMSEARRMVPGLSPQLQSALWMPDEAQVEPLLLMNALQSACEKSGVVFQENTEVHSIRHEPTSVFTIETANHRTPCKQVVIAAGAWSSTIQGVPKDMPTIKPIRGQMAQVNLLPVVATCMVASDDGYIIPRLDGRVVLGSTMEPVGFEKQVTVHGIYKLLTMAVQTIPALANATRLETWSGLRPASVTGNLLLGETSIKNMYLASGHHRNGILLAPETARCMADLIATGKRLPDLGYAAF